MMNQEYIPTGGTLSNNTHAEQVPIRRSLWGWHLLFWAFFFIILGFNVPHGAQVFLAVFGDTWENQVIAWAFMIGADVIVGYLTVARIQMALEKRERLKRGIYMAVIAGISLGSCYLQVLYNAHNFQPHLLSGAQSVPGFGWLPYLLSCLPLLTIVMASMASLVGRPAVREESTASSTLTHQEKLQAIREKAELRTARLSAWKETVTTALPAVSKQGLSQSQSQSSREMPTSPVATDMLPPPTTMPTPEPLLSGPETPAEGIVIVPSLIVEGTLRPPTPPIAASTDEEEETPTVRFIPIVPKENFVPRYNLRAERNLLQGMAYYTLKQAEERWGIREGTLVEFFDPRIEEMAPYWIYVNTGQERPNRHVQASEEARDAIVAYLQTVKPRSLLSVLKQGKAAGQVGGTKRQSRTTRVSSLQSVK